MQSRNWLRRGADGYHENHKNAFDTPYYADCEIVPDTLFRGRRHTRPAEFTSIMTAAGGINHENCKSALTYARPASSRDVRTLH